MFHSSKISTLAGIILVALFLFGCEEDSTVPELEMPNQAILDQYGRNLILHGWNTSSSAKGHPERQPWIVESDVERELVEFGNNFVRYLIFWDGVEPERGVYDEEYLDKVEERVNWYTSRGMYVMLDMHQDLYSIVFGGDGAPEWALETSGNPLDTNIDGPWWLANIDPAVIACWVNFWGYSEFQYLQDHYIDMWQHVAERFSNNPYVIGYDLMNEPWGGDLLKTFITGDFEKYQLSAFYDRLIPAMREADPDAYIFFEPAPAPVTFGAPSRLPVIEDTRLDSRIVYAPHCYPFDTHEGTGYTAGSRSQLRDWERNRRFEVNKHGGIPLVCGEFGLAANQDGFEDYMKDVLRMFDRNLWNWTYWSNDRGGWSPLDPDLQETPVLPFLVRPYPKATSGTLLSFEYKFNTGVFSMDFISMNTGMPTEIFIPERHFPDGWEIEVQGAQWSSDHDWATQTLKLTISEAGKEVHVQISPA